MKHLSFNKAYKVIALILCLFFITSFTYTDTLEEIRSIVSGYYGGGSIPSGVWTANTAEGILKALDDPYSDYLAAGEFKEFMDSINMDFVGIGVTVEQVSDGILIIGVIDGSGARQAGLMAGDIIIAVNDTLLSDISLETGTKLLKGEEGTTAHLTIRRGTSQFDVDVVRSKFTLPTIEWKVQDGNIGYIKINSFGAETGQEFGSALRELSSHNLTGYIIDLRNNGGGFIDAVLEIAGFFIGDKTAVSFKGASDISFSYNASLQPEQIKDKPIVFLANRYSASASELLLAAVKDYKAGMIIGEKTYGKGSMQDFFELSNGVILKLTVARFYSPNGLTVDKVGVLPNIQVESTLDEQAALLVMGDSGESIDKSGFINVSIGGIGYDIELNNAVTKENWLVYSNILNGVRSNNGKLILGTRSGWRDIPKDYWGKPWMLYYPNYSELAGLKDVPSDKRFTITFNKQVPVENVTNADVELIQSITGERIPMQFEQAEQSSVLAIPTTLLEKGKTYYLAIHPSIKDKDGHIMEKGAITQVSVR